MVLLNQMFAIIFYILFLGWLFFEIKNISIIKKIDGKEIYKNIKNVLKKKKVSKYLFKIINIFLVILFIYLFI